MCAAVTLRRRRGEIKLLADDHWLRDELHVLRCGHMVFSANIGHRLTREVVHLGPIHPLPLPHLSRGH